jgi:hypothetical protein
MQMGPGIFLRFLSCPLQIPYMRIPRKRVQASKASDLYLEVAQFEYRSGTGSLD